MIDAGSSGSRVHAYHFIRDAEGTPVLQSELFKQLKPGLSSYKDDPKAAADSLVPLFDAALTKIPAALQGRTPVAVKATAGLRMTGERQANAILASVRDLLDTYPFMIKPNPIEGVEIMDGLSEAKFAWVTVNYLKRTLALPAEKTSVMLDLGGGSTQIAIALPASKGNVARSEDYKTSTLLGTTHLLYLHSFLGQGLLVGRGGIFDENSDAAGACVPSSSTVSYKYGDKSWTIKGMPSTNAEGCMVVARKALRKTDFAGSIERPAQGQPIFAMSYYFDRGVDAGLISPDSETGSLTPQQFHDAANKACALDSTSAIKAAFPNTKDDTLEFLCTDLSFISTLLEDGFGISPTTDISLAKAIKFNGERVETQWTLGAALDAIV